MPRANRARAVLPLRLPSAGSPWRPRTPGDPEAGSTLQGSLGTGLGRGCRPTSGTELTAPAEGSWEEQPGGHRAPPFLMLEECCVTELWPGF